MIGHVAPARLALAEAKTAIESFGIAAYKTYSASDNDQAMESASAIEGEYNAAKSALNNVLTDDPAKSTTFAVFSASWSLPTASPSISKPR